MAENAVAKIVTAEPLVVLREEFDDWAMLFHPDTGATFALNPLGVFIWKLLDGAHPEDEIVSLIRGAFEDAPPDVELHLRSFIASLIALGLASPEGEGN